MPTTPYNTTADQEMLAIFTSKMTELRNMAAAMGQDIVTYTDEELGALQAQITALDPNGVSTAIAKITAFLDANDADGNNVIDALPGLISDLTSLTSRVGALEADNTATKARVGSLEGTQTQHGNAISAAQGDIANHKARIEALEAQEDDAGLSEDQVRAIAVEQDRALLGAVKDAFNVAFDSIVLTKGYPITGAPADDGGDLGAPG